MRTTRTLWVGVLWLAATSTGCATEDAALKREVADLRQEVGVLKAELDQLKRGQVVAEPRAIELPRAATAAPAASQATALAIALLKDGNILLNGQAVAREELQGKLAALAAEDPQASVVLSADQDVSHQRVVEVMDLVRAAGITRIGIATQSKP